MRPGELVEDRFQIEVLAGSGGMGSVYRARDLVTDRKVALKALHTEQASMVQRFVREAIILSELQHPNIVQYVAHGVDRGVPYLAMEWLEGEDLDQALLVRGRMSSTDTLTLISKVADALRLAHARGIVHRDLKPSNLFLVSGQPDQVKVLDFGIARGAKASYRLTKTGGVLGTPGFMAPEQARGSGAIGPAADVFSLGCVFYECLTGQPAFPGHHYMAVLAKILMEPAPRVGQLHPEVSPALDDLIARMLSKDPNERPADAGVLANELAKLSRATLGAPRMSDRPVTLTGEEQELLGVLMVQPVGNRLQSWATTFAAPPSDRAATEQANAADGTESLMSAAAHHGGKLEILREGTLVVLFTTETAATDLAFQAARCALAMQKLSPGASIALAIGRGIVKHDRPIGEVIDVAAGLLGAEATLAMESSHDALAAPSSRITIDPVTAGLIDSEFETTRDRSGALHLVGTRTQADSARRLLGKPTPCVGRERELATLSALFEQCIDEPMARAVLITAPAGVGKSRVRHEFVRRLRASAEGVNLWQARGDPTHAGSPFALLGQAVRSALGVVEGETLETAREKIRDAVSTILKTTDCVRVSEFLGELTGIHFPDRDSVELRSARRDPRIMRDQIARAWEDWLAAACTKAPVALILEDLHWGDVPSIKLVDSALRNLEGSPFFVLGLARPDVYDLFPGLWRERPLTDISLSALPKRACENLIRAVLGEAIAADVVARIVERSSGNAFYLEELIRAQSEGGSAEAPGTVVAMVQARLGRLPPEDRQILRAASIFGQIFWAGSVEALLGVSNSSAAIQDRLQALVETEWLRQRSEARFANEIEFGFRHALVRDAAYATLTEKDCKVGHRLAAEWLEQNGENAVPLAEHFKRGGELERATTEYERAAVQALQGNDLGGVLTYAQHALACGASGPARGRIRLIQAEVHNWKGEYELAAQYGSEALLELDANALDDPNGRWAHAMHQIMWASASLGKIADVQHFASELLRGADEQKHELRIIGLSMAAQHLSTMGHANSAWPIIKWLERHAQEGVERDPLLTGVIKQAHGMYYTTTGDPGTALHFYQAATQDFRRAGDQRMMYLDLSNIGNSRASLGDYEQAEADLRAALELGKRLDIALSYVRLNLGFTLIRMGKPEAAEEFLQSALIDFQNQQDRRGEAGARCCLSSYFLLRGDPSHAEHEARGAAELSASLPALGALAHATLASALLAQGRTSEAAQAARLAFQLATTQASIEEGEAFIHLVHTECLAADSDQVGARKALRTAYDWVLASASRIDNEALRHSFLTRVAENARILELAREWLLE